MKYSNLVFLSSVLTGSTTVVHAATKAKKDALPNSSPPQPVRSTDFISCNDPCNGGDVNYELKTTVRTLPLMNYTYRGRTYDNPDDPSSVMGPTMRVKPGQSLWIKLRNELNDRDIGPRDPSAIDYWRMLQNPGKCTCPNRCMSL